MSVARTLSGARTIFQWHGLDVGYAAAMSGEENIEFAPVEILNLIQVREHNPVAYRCSFNSSLFRRLGQHARNTPNDNLNYRIMPAIGDILITEGVDAIAVHGDGAGGQASGGVLAGTGCIESNLYIFKNAKCSSRSWDTAARGLALEALAFVATRMENDTSTADTEAMSTKP